MLNRALIGCFTSTLRPIKVSGNTPESPHLRSKPMRPIPPWQHLWPSLRRVNPLLTSTPTHNLLLPKQSRSSLTIIMRAVARRHRCKRLRRMLFLRHGQSTLTQSAVVLFMQTRKQIRPRGTSPLPRYSTLQLQCRRFNHNKVRQHQRTLALTLRRRLRTCKVSILPLTLLRNRTFVWRPQGVHRSLWLLL
jgi:hypothetical protein